VLLELVEALGPDLTAAVDPVDRAVEHGGLEVTRTELRPPTTRDEPAALEHLQVLRDRGKAEVERLGQLVHRGVAGGEASQDRSTRRVGKRPERRVELVL